MSFSADHLEVTLRPSKWHGVLLTLVHLLALVALGFAGLEPWLAVALGLAVLASFARSLLRSCLLRDAGSVVRIAWHDGQWQLVTGAGNLVPVSLDPSVVVLSWLVIVHFRDANRRRYTVVLLPDSTSPDELRRLRVLLKWQRQQ